MTRYTDNIESGFTGLTSAQSTRAAVSLTRQRRFTGGGNQTWTGFFPYGAQCFNANLYILANGSAATTDRLTITTSGTTTLCTFASMGSAQGFLTGTTTGLGTKTVVASAAYQLGPNIEGADVPFTVILSSTDTATDYGLAMYFRRPFAVGT